LSWKIPLFDTEFDAAELDAVSDVIRSGWLTMGAQVQIFEERFAEFIGTRYAIAVSSGTAALHLANRALGIGPGDEVICTALTFVAGPNSVLYTGAVPVFADIEGEHNFSISPEDVAKRISPKTKAIQVVHYAGYPCDMDSIMTLARKHGLAVVEDCAHAPGARYKDRNVGAISDIGCFSLFSNKNMTTGEGGMVTTDDELFAKQMRSLRSHAMTTDSFARHHGDSFSYDVDDLGYNYRLDEIRAAFGLVQLKKLPEYNLRRRQIRTWYENSLSEIADITMPYRGANEEAAWHILPILLPNGHDKFAFMSQMKKRGIQTSVHYPPAHQFSFYRKLFSDKNISLPITEHVTQREVTLPFYTSMTEENVSYVCESVAASLKG